MTDSGEFDARPVRAFLRRRLDEGRRTHVALRLSHKDYIESDGRDGGGS